MKRHYNILLPIILSIWGTLQLYCENIDKNSLDKIIYDNKDLNVDQLVKDAWQSVENGDYEKATLLYTLAAAKYSDNLTLTEIESCATSYVNVGFLLLSWKNNAAEAYPWLIKAEEICQKHDLRRVEIGIYSNLGQIYFDYNDFEKSIEYYKKAFHNITTLSYNNYYAQCLIEMATAAVVADSLGLIGDEIDFAYSQNLDSNQRLATYTDYFSKALKNLKNRDYKNAIALLETGKKYFRIKTDSVKYLTYHNIISAYAYSKEGDSQNALKVLHSTINLADKYKLYDIKSRGYDMVSNIYKQSGRKDSSLYFEYKSLHLRDSVYGITKFSKLKDAEYSSEITTLHNKAIEDGRNIKAQKQKILYLSCVGFVLIVLLVLLYIYNRKLKNAYKDLFGKNIQLLDKDVITSNDQAEHIQKGKEGSNKKPEGDKNLSEETADIDYVLFEKIKEIMTNSQEIYDTDFSIERLSEMTDEKVKKVSQTINQLANCNFNSYLGTFRIKKACVILSNPDSVRKYSINNVSLAVGYKSRTHFSKVFKSITGLTPSQFQKQALKNINHEIID